MMFLGNHIPPRCSSLMILLGVSSLIIETSASGVIFFEPFADAFDDRWVVSEKEGYDGVWKHEKSEGHDDYGLLVSEKARNYAIVKELDEPVDLKDRTVVLQFEMRPQNGLECGGAYLKFLRSQNRGWNPKEFGQDSPYSIMFGPDKCGTTDKVHFILNHKNPKTGEYSEHHLNFPPSVPFDRLSHVYTAVLKQDNQLVILIDGEERKKADFLSKEDFDPPIFPPQTLPDPDEEKPEDWDERETIPDPNAAKPEDWDENAPMEIEDEEALKPKGWLDGEPEEIHDPDAAKPDDWDDEEDGEWEAPMIDNPACEEAPGCGEWRRPVKRNPDYKGQWDAPVIDNPNYRGNWEAKEIPNPGYFELERPEFEAIAAVGIEIWTMQDGILFDSILIATDEKAAEYYRESAWRPKFEVEEEEKQRADEAATGVTEGLSGVQKVVFDLLYRIPDIPFLDPVKFEIVDLIGKGEGKPNLTVGIVFSTAILVFTIVFKIIFGRKKNARRPKPMADAETSPRETTEKEEDDGKGEGAAGGPRRRSAARRED